MNDQVDIMPTTRSVSWVSASFITTQEFKTTNKTLTSQRTALMSVLIPYLTCSDDSLYGLLEEIFKCYSAYNLQATIPVTGEAVLGEPLVPWVQCDSCQKMAVRRTITTTAY